VACTATSALPVIFGKDSDGKPEKLVEASAINLGTVSANLFLSAGTNIATMIGTTHDHAHLQGLNDDDHSHVYLSKAKLASVAAGSGAAYIGIQDAQAYYSGTTVESALEQVSHTINIGDAAIASDTLTFTNKTFDVEGTGNSIANIDVADLKSGVLDTDLASVAGTDTTLPSAKATKAYVDSGTATLTNKTFDVEGTGNSISNIDVADLKSGVLDTDLDSVAGTDTTLASAKAIKSYVDNSLVGESNVWDDNIALELGSGGDSTISYDGANTVWNLQKLGTGDLAISGGVTLSGGGDLKLNDNIKLILGTGSDVSLKFDGAHTIFDLGSATHSLNVSGTKRRTQMVVEASATSSILEASGLDTKISNTAAGNMVFETNGATVMTLENGGKVGVGTTNPGQAIDVVNTTADTQVSMRVDNQDGGATSDARLILKVASTGGDAYVRMFENGGNSWCMGAYTQGSPGTNFRITDHTNLDSNVAIEIDASQDIWMPQTLAVGQSAQAADYVILECDSTTKAFLPPRMTTTQRNAIGGGVANPATGSVIYNTTTNVLNFWNGSAWGAV